MTVMHFSRLRHSLRRERNEVRVPNFTTPHSNSLPQGEREVRLELRSDDKIFCRIRVKSPDLRCNPCVPLGTSLNVPVARIFRFAALVATPGARRRHYLPTVRIWPRISPPGE